MARTIAGELTLPDGTPLANATIHLTAKRTEATRILEDVSSSFTTSSTGAYSQSVETGYYAVSVSYAAVPGTQPRRWHLGDVWVEDGDPISLTALLSLNNSAADPTDAALQQMLADAQAARDEAQAAAQQAEQYRDETASMLDSKIDESEKGEPGGVATLDSGGRVPAGQLPSYVDDVEEYADYASLPRPAEAGKIYITLDTNRQYRWGGSDYIELVASPGTTDNVPEGSSNLYHTAARVRAVTLAGIEFVSSAAITAADSILSAFGKVQAQLNNKIDDDDERLTDARDWTAPIVNEDEAESGEGSEPRKWTAQRVWQAVAGWWDGSSAKQTLDTVFGWGDHAEAGYYSPDNVGAPAQSLLSASTEEVARAAIGFDSVSPATPANGGLLVDNQKTGTGLERVLTESDLEGGGGGSGESYESVAAFIASTPSANVANIISYYGGWSGTVEGPKGGFTAHRTGYTAATPSVGDPVAPSTIGTGDQEGYFWDASGAEWKRSEQLYNVHMRPAKADLFIIYGQSNAVGRAANSTGRPEIADGGYYWSRANGDIRQLAHDYENCDPSANNSSGNAWVAFANRYTNEAGVSAIFLPAAAGGKSISDLQKGGAVYSAMSTEYAKLRDELDSQGWSIGRVFCVFSQGETDQSNGTSREDYINLMRMVFNDMKTDFDVEHFFISLVGNSKSRSEESWHVIRAAQVYAADGFDDVSVGFENAKNFYEYNNMLLGDGTHYSQRGYNLMGYEMAGAVIEFLGLKNPNTNEQLTKYNYPTISSGLHPKFITAAIKLTSTGAELMTYDGSKPSWSGAPNYQTSFVTGVSLADNRVNIAIDGTRVNTVNFVHVTAEDRYNPSESIHATARPLHVVGTNDRYIQFAVRMTKDLQAAVQTNDGSIYKDTFSNALNTFGPSTVSATKRASETEVSIRNGLSESYNRPALVAWGKPTLPVSQKPDAPQVVYDSAKDSSLVYLPNDAGWMILHAPGVLINPEDIPAGDEIIIVVSALVSWN